MELTRGSSYKKNDVANQILKMIQNKKLKQGDIIGPERELAKELNISRGKLRESLKALEKLGVIETKPGGGRYLRNISTYRGAHLEALESLEKAAIYDLLEARESIECKILELIIKKASDDEIRNIENKANNPDDSSFHLELAKASQNVVLYNFMKINLELLIDASKKIIKVAPKRKEIMVIEHQEIVGAIKERDIVKAQMCLYYHLRNIRDNI